MWSSLLDVLKASLIVILGFFVLHSCVRMSTVARPQQAPIRYWWERDQQLLVFSPHEGTKLAQLRELNASLKRPFLLAQIIDIKQDKVTEGLESALQSIRRHVNLKTIIKVSHFGHNVDLEVIEWVRNNQLSKVILIHSPFDNVLRQTRLQEPSIPIGTGKGEASRLLIMSQMFLETAAPMTGDVYFTDIFDNNMRPLTPRLIHEVKRRDKRIIVGPIDVESQWKQVLAMKIDGIITNNPVGFLKFIARSKFH